ncbi:TetR family transcriptional regulator [Prauserella marina]|uniref:DNA-binding transcriptional regulator, AcrR family n=1 Tax=Prauserella marina TaxID=530584 RepID=A0A222VKN8_9PSEU|nr:TetR/AcrR family transcriptional regulator [Prauserella marina]ASR34490.1 TetR family transcriptional regulator [Prauserella marina]PWV85912.1 TetR family transcriptional regulator [Prauserella marina]SDC42489.1 DNA-binding transcriptional regulator, AcrR family [Prauserella marina]
MDQRRTAPRVRMTLAERKRETKDALVLAALYAFARDGYHAASLEAIATEAGYSKGAIYSNFTGKAELFLAVMDYNLEALRSDDWDPLTAEHARDTAAAPEADAATMVRGVGLATLEFIATAARDETLAEALRRRVQAMVDSYQQVAAEAVREDETLAADDVARLMAALDQGASMLTLSGITAMDGTLLRTGLRRLLSPEQTAPEQGERGLPLPVVERVQRLIGNPDSA